MTYRIEQLKSSKRRGKYRQIVKDLGDVTIGQARDGYREWAAKHPSDPPVYRLVNGKDVIVEQGGR